jgi:gamma-glutamylcyclotransferase (GGCT)/AIG2-like uncharacterized protein YtfP
MWPQFGLPSAMQPNRDHMENAPNRLAVYGTLAPGKPNHHQLAGLKGTWQRGIVRGRLFPAGWGATLGYPALILDDDAEAIGVDLFESSDLNLAWDRLDEFEGSGYTRTIASVVVDDGRQVSAVSTCWQPE